MSVEVVDLGGVEVVVLPVIRGLASERMRVRAAIEEVRPAAVGLSISPEELSMLRAHPSGDPEPPGAEEEAYAAGLSEFGEVEEPLRGFGEGIDVAGHGGIPVHPLDMDEEALSSAYLAAVSGWEFILSGARASKMRRWRARADSAEAFVLAWDAQTNQSKGLRDLQRQRERHMAHRIRELARDRGPVLALVELERAKGVVERLRD